MLICKSVITKLCQLIEYFLILVYLRYGCDLLNIVVKYFLLAIWKSFSIRKILFYLRPGFFLLTPSVNPVFQKFSNLFIPPLLKITGCNTFIPENTGAVGSNKIFTFGQIKKIRLNFTCHILHTMLTVSTTAYIKKPWGLSEFTPCKHNNSPSILVWDGLLGKSNPPFYLSRTINFFLIPCTSPPWIAKLEIDLIFLYLLTI